MLWFFRKKSPTQKACLIIRRKCRRAQPTEQAGAGMVIDVLHGALAGEFGSLSEFCSRPREVQNEYIKRLGHMQDHKQAKLGTDLFGLWVISAQVGDTVTRDAVESIMKQFSRQANHVRP
ncbi:hypothetical protein PFAS1_16060 [Pseudomonas frederiksbergensis]|nr:hypothetical protein PFAS1_16060 [Pseudomonas frederiksbergensis]